VNFADVVFLCFWSALHRFVVSPMDGCAVIIVMQYVLYYALFSEFAVQVCGVGFVPVLEVSNCT
jgi:hypothetical protein